MTDMTTLVLRASVFADAAHAAVGQRRKYTGDTYIVHPRAVAMLVSRAHGTLEMKAAALLHDVLEDTKVTADLLDRHFGEVVTDYVILLTDHYTPENFPNMNRAARKEAEAVRYESVPNEVKTIKLADMIDNTNSIGLYYPGFLKTYGPEKRRLLRSLMGGNAGLWELANEKLVELGY